MFNILLISLALFGQAPLDQDFDVAQTESIANFKLPVWEKTSCVIEQQNSDWIINYSFRAVKNCPDTISENVAIKVVGYVSNSGVPDHEFHRWSELDSRARSVFEHKTCKEKLLIENLDSKNGILSIQIKLNHSHPIFAYSPLLGKRQITINIDTWHYSELLDMSREQYHALPNSNLTHNDDKADDTYFLSPPHSLYLNSNLPGEQYYRFSEVPLRAGTRMELSFYYYMPQQPDGNFQCRWCEYRETEGSWKVLSDYSFEEVLKPTGKRWKKYTKRFTVSPETTTGAFDVRIGNSEWGEVWIDNISLKPINLIEDRP